MKTTFNKFYITTFLIILSLLIFLDKNITDMAKPIIFLFIIINIKEIMDVCKKINFSWKDGLNVEGKNPQPKKINKEKSLLTIEKKEKKSSLKCLPNLENNDYKNAIIDKENLIKHQIDKSIYSNNKEELLIRELAQRVLSVEAERIYRDIYGGQIKLLQILKNKNLTEEECKEFYKNLQKEKKKFYKNYSFEEWIHFLTGYSKFIRHEKGQYLITELGMAFIQYIFDMGYRINKVG